MKEGSDNEDEAMARLSGKIGTWLGLDLERGGRRSALRSFVSDRMLALGCQSIPSYVELITHKDHPELTLLSDAITVGHTWFFRDEGQMTLLSDLLGSGSGPFYAWVPGCASGEDVYSLAMLAERAGRSIHVLGSDISTRSLVLARKGCYPDRVLPDVPETLRRYLLPVAPDTVQVSEGVRQKVRFVRHNLVDPPLVAPSGRGWDLILCRNVLIYFRADVAQATVARIGKSLSVGGALILGASEVLHVLPQELRMQQRAGRYVLTRTSSAPQAQKKQEDLRKSSDFVVSSSDFVAGLLHLADEHMVGGRAVDAIPLYEQVLQEQPSRPEVHLLCGVANHLSGRWEAGCFALHRCLQLRPDAWAASYYLGLCLEKLGLLSQAQRAFFKVLEGASEGLLGPSSVLIEIEACKVEIQSAIRERVRRSAKTNLETERS